jgi:hypothetical protein
MKSDKLYYEGGHMIDQEYWDTGFVDYAKKVKRLSRFGQDKG